MGISMDRILFAEPFLRRQVENPFAKWKALATNKIDLTKESHTEPLFLLKDKANLKLLISVMLLILASVLGLVIIFLVLRRRQQTKVCTEEEEAEVVEDEENYSGSDYLEDFSEDEVNNTHSKTQNNNNNKIAQVEKHRGSICKDNLGR